MPAWAGWRPTSSRDAPTGRHSRNEGAGILERARLAARLRDGAAARATLREPLRASPWWCWQPQDSAHPPHSTYGNLRRRGCAAPSRQVLTMLTLSVSDSNTMCASARLTGEDGATFPLRSENSFS